MSLALRRKAARASQLTVSSLMAGLAFWSGLMLLRQGEPEAATVLSFVATFAGVVWWLSHDSPLRGGQLSLRSLPVAVAVALAVAALVESLMSGRLPGTPPALVATALISVVAVGFACARPCSYIARFFDPTPGGAGILVIGNNRRTQELIDRWRAEAPCATRRVGFLDVLENTDPARRNTQLDQWRFLGGVSQLERVLRDEVVDEVWVTLPVKSCYDAIGEVVRLCRTVGVSVRSPAAPFDDELSEVPTRENRHFEGLYYTAGGGAWWQFAVKRLIDVMGSLVLILLLSPVMLVAAAATKLTSRGRILFRQDRLGLSGRRFVLYKFRSMVEDAEELQDSLADANEVSGPVFKMKDDPRVTWVGRFLRKWSIDELPQLFNVLKGDMSLVGPRPPMVREVPEYEPWQLRRLSVKPGLTCIWQVSGRSEISFDEWMHMDLAYIDTWSLAGDLGLIFKTIPAVLGRRGAS